MNWLKSRKIVVTHNGHFHADDVLSVAAIRLLPGFRFARLIRTREANLFSKGDIVVDVGAAYDPATDRFDHHQTGGAGTNPNGIPYSGFGLLWKKYGEQMCGSAEASEIVRKRLVQTIDATDNGFLFSKVIVDDVSPYDLDDLIKSFNLSWTEKYSQRRENKRFEVAVKIAGQILRREIKNAKDRVKAASIVEKFYADSVDKQIIIIDKYLPFMDTLIKYSEPRFAVVPHSIPGVWVARALKVAENSNELRQSFPKSWAGKRDDEMVKVSGVADAIFCHNNLFLASAKSKEGAIRLAQIALENNK